MTRRWWRAPDGRVVASPTSSSRAGISAATGRRRPTSVTGRRRPTSPTSRRWAAAATALLVACLRPDRSRSTLAGAAGRRTGRRGARGRRGGGRRRHLRQSGHHDRGDRPGRSGRPRAGPALAAPSPGDMVALAGRVGPGRCRYTVLSRGFRSPKVLVEAYRRPVVPYAAGPAAAELGATSMIDVPTGCWPTWATSPRRARRHRHPPGRVRRHPADARRVVRPWASTRTPGCSAAATTIRWSRRSRPTRRCPRTGG